MMEYLAYHADMEPGTAYLVGLMHGIGRYPIALKMQKVKPSMRAPQGLHLLDLAAWERKMLDVDYAKIGMELLKLWRFGPEVYEPVGLHLQPFMRQEKQGIACLLNICLSVLPCLMDEELPLPELPESHLSSVGLSMEILSACLGPSRAWLFSTNSLLEESTQLP